MASSSLMTKTLPLSMTWLQEQARKLVFRQLSCLQHGELLVQEGGHNYEFGQSSPDHLQAILHVHDAQFYVDLLKGGSVAAGESYMQGMWDSPQLSKLIQLMARNIKTLDNLNSWLSQLTHWTNRLFHYRHLNTVQGSKQNIAAHYDLGNAFYQCFLDPSMMYSCALFQPGQEDLQQAQLHKLAVICQRLDLQPNDQVIEIGSGWGGFAIYAAKHYDVHVTTTTISEQQYLYAKQQIEKEQLQDRITLLKQDYRTLEGRFDKLVSIEMIEAVGMRYLPAFFQLCERLLKPNGKMLLQAITMPAQRFDYYRQHTDFIQRYIFPGGFLPSVPLMSNLLAKNTQFQIHGLHDIGLDYATTLWHWSKRLKQAKPQLESLGLNEQFYRMWDYYLQYCEGGFRERSISTVHLIADKPAWERV